MTGKLRQVDHHDLDMLTASVDRGGVTEIQTWLSDDKGRHQAVTTIDQDSGRIESNTTLAFAWN